MRILAAMKLWVRALFARRDVERSLDREMRFHLEMETEKNRRAGMPAAEAARQARIAFGGVERHREAVRDERGVRALDDLMMDLRYGLRGLRRAPGFTAAAIVILGLGIGAATAVSTTVNHVLRGALPYPDPGRLVFVSEATKSGDAMLTSYPNFDDWRRDAHSFSGLAAFMPVGTSPVVVGGRAVRARTQAVSREFFSVFGVAPVAGRTIRPDENAPGAPLVAVVSERFWRTEMGAPGNLAGTTLRLDGGLYQVVGVMPASFRVLEDADIWVAGEGQPVQVRGAGNYWVVGRLAPEATLDAARREMNAIAASLKLRYGDASISSAVVAEPLVTRVVGDARRPLLMLLVAGLFVLVVTCVSVAMMQLSRTASRQREIGIRTTLGAGRLRLARQLITEQLTLAGLGCAAGLAVAWMAVAATRRFGVGILPRIDDLAVDPWMLAIAVGASIVAVVLFGAAPVARLLRRPGIAASRAARAPRTSRYWRGNVLVGAQAAVTVLLVVGAALLVRSVSNVLTANLGYDRQGLVSVNVPLYGGRYNQLAVRVTTAERMRDVLGRIPGVEQIGLTSQLPYQTGGNRGPILVPPFGDPSAQSSWSAIAGLRVVSPNYFAVMRTPLLRGRMLDATDGADSRRVVINQSLAQRLWPGKDAVGRQLRALVDQHNDTLTVAGVVGDARDWQSGEGAQPELYLTIAQRPEDAWQMNAVMRTRGDPASIVPEIYRAMRDIDPELAPVARTLEDVVTSSVADRRFVTGVLLAFAVVVLVLTVAGIAGSVSYAIRRRTRELGIRMAIGASRLDVWLLVQRGVIASALVGGAVGLAASLELGSLVSSLLYGMTSRDPLALAAALGVTLLAVIGAASLPALRAARIDPAVAVRME